MSRPSGRHFHTGESHAPPVAVHEAISVSPFHTRSPFGPVVVVVVVVVIVVVVLSTAKQGSKNDGLGYTLQFSGGEK